MPGLVIPPSAPTTPNVTAEVPISGGLSVTAGQYLYSTTLARILAATGEMGAFQWVLSNAGTIWVDYAAGARVLDQLNWGYINNSGTMLAHSANGDAVTISIGSAFQGLSNSGSIYALSDSKFAVAIEYWSSGASFENSGVIAARGATGANVVRGFNGGDIVNLASGAILAEGPNARALVLLGNATVLNHGRIEAESADPNQPSIGILGESIAVDNHGVIRADIAILGTSSTTDPHKPQDVTNHAGGLIEGAIYLGYGEDQVVNRGQINGYVDLGDGVDLFDNSQGQHVGNTNLGWGEDAYVGGTGTDAVTGDRGADVISGGQGNDLLLGGFGNDLLRGDAGNDGLYGEGGNDRIFTSAGDTVYAGAGNDQVLLGDYQFRHVDGQAGHDVLILPADGRILDLSQVASSGRVVAFEEIQLAADGRIVVRPSDVGQLSDGASTLMISDDGDGVVYLVGSWAAGTVQVIGGATYVSYSSGGSQLLVAAGLSVQIGAAPPGAAGLDPVASGALPLVPGAVPGADLTPILTIIDGGFALESDLEIDASEEWRTNGEISLVYAGSSLPSLINHGVMIAHGNNAGARVVSGGNFNDLINYGTIAADAFSGTAQLANNQNMVATYGIHNMVTNLGGNAWGVNLWSAAVHFENNGILSAATDQAIAVGYHTYGAPGENHGTISATSTHFIGVGVFAHNGGEFVNSGTIEASGAWGAYGVGTASHALAVVNSGSIIAHSTDATRSGIAVYIYYASGIQQLTNSGLIVGEVAIQSSWTVNGGNLWLANSGEIRGRIDLGINPNGGPAREDIIINSGTIEGSVALGDGRDIYDGTGGTQTGIVKGEGGSDLLIGTSGRDTLDGGAGDDVLVGGGGDTLTGGAGSDIFIFNLVIAGRPANAIIDFAAGTDKIDLRPLAPTSVTISGSTITATTSQGTLTITVSGSVSMADLVVSSPTSGTAGDDVLVAGPGGATLTGEEGFDLLYGGAGNDRLNGGTGGTSGLGEIADMLFGGAGNDTYVVDSRADIVIERANDGTDTIEAVPGLYNFTFYMPDHVENFVGGSAVGNAADNMMTGDASSNGYDGGAGNDVITGNGGADFLTGGAGADRFVYTALEDSPGVGDKLLDFEHGVDVIDLGTLGATGITFFGTVYPDVFTDLTIHTAGGPMTLQIDRYVDHSDFGTAFQSTKGTSGNDNLVGTANSEWLEGGNGDDWLNGGAASDTLHGGEGADALIGGAGRDALLGGGGADRFYLDGFSDSADRIGDFGSGDQIYLDSAVFSALTAGALYATKFANAGGQSAGTRIIYDSYSGRISYDPDGTGSAAWVVIGYVKPGTQLTAASFFVYSGNPQAIESSVSYTLVGTEQNLVLTGSNPVSGTGNALDNSITGNSATNQLLGMAGNDTLTGNAGDDTLDGGAGADVLDGGDGDDSIVYDAADNAAQVTGGAGTDTLLVNGSLPPTGFNLVAQGFERAEVRLTDAAGSPWTSITQYYNSSWTLLQQVTINDNGSRVVVDYDHNNSQPTSQVGSSYDALSRLSSVDQLFDDSTRTFINVDEASNQIWTQDWFQYDALGRLSSEDVLFDNGTRTFINLDEAAAQSWAQDWYTYDAQGRLSSQDVIYDDGTRTFINMDEAGAHSWAQDWFAYDAQVRLSSEDVIHDNGTRTFINLDQDNSQSWNQVWFGYDDQGHLDTQDVLYDDGSRTFYNYDQAGTEAFAVTAILYNTAGTAYQQVTTWDDGSTSYTMI